jgi:O-antigen/teichoic acid export membrane protein
MSILHSLVKNTLARTLTELINRFGAAIFWVFIARQLGASALGALAFGMSLFSFFLTVSTLGLGSVVIREVARDCRKAGAYFGHTIVFGAASAFIMTLVMILVSLLIKPGLETIYAAIILAFAIIPASWFYWSKSLLSATENMSKIALARFGENLFKVIVGVALLIFGAGVLEMAIVILASKCVSAIIAFILASRIAQPEFKLQRDIVKNLYNMTPSFSMIALFNSLFWAAPVVILTRLGGEVEAGLFSAAYKLVDVVITFAHAYGQALFPIASRTAQNDAVAFKTLFLKSVKYVSLLTLAIAAGISVLASDIVAFIYGNGMTEVASILRVLIWMAAPFSIVPILAFSLMSHNRQNSDLLGNIAAAVTVILLGVLTSSTYGALGMAYSVVGACVVFWGVEFFSVQRDVFSFSIGEQVWRPALAAAFLAALLLLFKDSNIFIGVALAGCGYILFLLLSKTITKNEWKMVKQLKSIQ